jgi:hypothetical protein
MALLSDTKQLVILKLMTAHLEGITFDAVVPTDDFESDNAQQTYTLTGKVYRGRTIFGAEEGAGPFISILEGKKPDNLPPEVGYANLERYEDWHLLVQGWMDDDPETPLDNLYRFKGAVESRLAMIVAVDTQFDRPLYPDIYLLGGLVSEVRIGPGIVRPTTPTPGGTEGFYLPVIVTFAINVANPTDLSNT